MAVDLNSSICFRKSGTTYKTRAITSKSDITADHYLCFRKSGTTYYVPLLTAETSDTTATPLKVRASGTTYTAMKVTPMCTVTYSYTSGSFLSFLSATISINVPFTTDLSFSISYTNKGTTYTLGSGTLTAGSTSTEQQFASLGAKANVTNISVTIGSWSFSFTPSSGTYTKKLN